MCVTRLVIVAASKTSGWENGLQETIVSSRLSHKLPLMKMMTIMIMEHGAIAKKQRVVTWLVVRTHHVLLSGFT